MFISKVKMLAATLLACTAALAVTVVAVGQRPAENDKKKEAPPAAKAKVEIEAKPLSPEALAAHLGVTHQSFELTFEKPVDELFLSIDIYEKGVRTVEGRTLKVVTGFAKAKHACSVLYAPWKEKEQGKLHITVRTQWSTFHELIENPFSDPRGWTIPDPQDIDAEGRIPLALQTPEDYKGDFARIPLKDAAKAIVVQVRTK